MMSLSFVSFAFLRNTRGCPLLPKIPGRPASSPPVSL
ncbi:protein of unknown function [Cyanobium sp. NIES-981]|nr:protein of unknown function [Cyanobium sp. NIES-981]